MKTRVGEHTGAGDLFFLAHRLLNYLTYMNMSTYIRRNGIFLALGEQVNRGNGPGYKSFLRINI